jgi:predicted transcriptional regulator
MLLHEMRRLLEEEAPGPHPSFALVHGLYAIFIIDGGSVGRQRLAAGLSLGEGSVRTLLRKLTKRGIVVTDRAGCRLTSKGKKLYEEAKEAFQLFQPAAGAVVGTRSYGVVVRGGGSLAKGVAERDEAIKAGADGAITLSYTGKALHMPGLSNVTKEHPDLARSIPADISLRDGDAIIIAICEEDCGRALVYGALSAAWALFEGLSDRR